MKDELTNRMGMFDTSLKVLNSEIMKAVWFKQPPVIFTTKVGLTANAVAALKQFCKAQGVSTLGSAAQKAKEGAEAEAAVNTMAAALVEWFGDQNDQINLAKVNLTPTDLHAMRDEAQKNQMYLTLDLANDVVAGPNAAQAADYGITASAIQLVQTEVDEYAAVLSAPQSSIAQRKAMTDNLRDQFNAVEDKFVSLDNLIQQFGTTDAGRNLVAAYTAARIVRDLGHGPTPVVPAPAPTPVAQFAAK